MSILVAEQINSTSVGTAGHFYGESKFESVVVSIPSRYLKLAADLRHTQHLEDGTFFTEIPGFNGLYGSGQDEESAAIDLAEALVDWVYLKIISKDDDLPIMDRIDLNTG